MVFFEEFVEWVKDVLLCEFCEDCGFCCDGGCGGSCGLCCECEGLCLE